MGCFSCIPPPASLKPRKTYNFLVPDVFPLKSPAENDPVPHSIQRKIGKLQEYVQRNPDKVPKASRTDRDLIGDWIFQADYYCRCRVVSRVAFTRACMRTTSGTSA